MPIETVIHIIIALVYVPVCLIVFWRLFPHLSPTSKRLAAFMLAAQVFVITLSQENMPVARFDRWIWDLDQERNIAATLASTQLALVGAVALLTTWLARTQPTWQRLYLAGFGLVFLFFAGDEFLRIHEELRHWPLYFAAFGALVVSATVVVAARSPQRTWPLYLCLLTGIALSATGGILIEQFRFPEVCGYWGFLRNGRCLLYNIEEPFEFLGVWLTLVAVLGLFSSAAPRPRPLIRRFLYIAPAVWILVLRPPSPLPHIDLRFFHQAAQVRFESGEELQAYKIETGGGSIALDFFVSFDKWGKHNPSRYSLHLVDQLTGETIAAADDRSTDLQKWIVSFYEGTRNTKIRMYKHKIEVRVPGGIPTKRAFWLALSHGSKDGAEHLRKSIISSDHLLLDETQVVLGERLGPSAAAVSSTTLVAAPNDGFTLVSSGMPDSAATHENVSITFVRGTEASIQFESGLHLQGIVADYGEEAAILRLYASARHEVYEALGYSIHLVDQVSGRSVARLDEWANPDRRFFHSDYLPVYHQKMEIKIPRQAPTNRAFSVVLSVWTKVGEAYVSQKIESSDRPLYNDTQVVIDELVLPTDADAPSSVPVAKFDNGFTLDAVDLPERAQAGKTVPISFAWRADKESREDTVQFLHFGYVSPPREEGSVEGEAESVESGAWWGHDQQPLGARLPTRLWYSGLADTETWEVALPADLAPGRYTVYTGLYRVNDQVRLPAIDAEDAPIVDARVPLGVLIVEGA